jgi:pectin methylesterase-like acyl-CoA thioesterase
VDAAPEVEGDSDRDDDGWHVIRVKEGVYEEIVRVPWGEKKRKKRMAMVGEGMGRSVITGSLNAQMPGLTTYDTATVGEGSLSSRARIGRQAIESVWMDGWMDPIHSSAQWKAIDGWID